jgi:hypothetical protein
MPCHSAKARRLLAQGKARVRWNKLGLSYIQLAWEQEPGVRHPYGGTRALGFKRGTLVRHPRYGLASVGGCDRRSGTLSLHAYRTNKRLTQKAKGTTLVRLTWTPYRTYLVSEAQPKSALKPDRAKGAMGAPPTAKAGRFPLLKESSL